MFTNQIHPIISEATYNSLKAQFGNCMANCTFLELSKTFILSAKKFYKMDYIATILGTSVKHLYRILSKEHDFSKQGKLNTLLLHLFNSSSYANFIYKTCNDFKVKEK